MRIIAGAWRGRALVAPEGEGTRPTRWSVAFRMYAETVSRLVAAFEIRMSFSVSLKRTR